MERTNNKITKEVDAILTADWHLREDNPVCRTDDFVNDAQWKKVDFISDLQKKYGCAVFHAGDLFDYWKPSPDLLSKASQHIPKEFISIFGNHDLPQHNLELAEKCGLYNLMINGKVAIPAAHHWNMVPSGGGFWVINGKKMTMWHVMTYQGKEPWPGCTDPKGSTILRKHPTYDLILTGDNHKPFVEEHQGRLLVNPGSIFRMTAAQADHLPRVYLWHASDNSVTPVYLPIEPEVISREHIDHKDQRDARIDAFIEKLDGDWQASLTFEENIEIFQKTNQTRQSVMEIVYKAIES